MFGNLKINTSGQGEIIDIYSWMDGGTVTVKLATLDNSKFEVEFVQKADLRVTDRNPNPGRLLLNKKVVEIRSDLEANIIKILKNALYSEDPLHDNKNFRKCLAEAISFVESNNYVLIANQIAQKK